MNDLLSVLFSTNFAFSMIRVTTPILFAALGALISNRAGIVNIGMEGTMLVGALAGVVVSAATQNVWLGLARAVASGVLLAAVLALFTLRFKTHIILGGVALNMLASGGTVFVLYLISGDKGASTSLASLTLPAVNLPLIQDIPVVGAIVSGHNLLTYVAFAAVLAIWYLLHRTPLGLRIRSVGESPQAAQSVGVSVVKTQTIALLISGLLAALGGAFLSMGYLSLFTRDMTASRGWVAIAAEAMGRGSTWGTSLVAFLFGGADALANALQVLKVPAELIGTTPYVATVVALLLYSIAQSRSKKRKAP